MVFLKGYDVIYCDDSFPFYPLFVKMASPRSKVIIRLGDFHLMYYFSGWKYRFLHFFEKQGWKAADKILSISEAMQEQLASEGFSSVVVPDPVEPANFITDEKPGTDKIVMFHGVITRNKNLDVMLKAALLMPEIYFWIVGDGPDAQRLMGQATENVVFTGWHDYKTINNLIGHCHIGLALRSDNPGNEYVVTSPFLQYAASGKPCLVTRRKVFGKYKWQFSNVGEMIDKIQYLLKHPEEGKKLQKRVLKRHNARKVADQIWYQLSS